MKDGSVRCIEDYVTCAVCGRDYVGKVPKGVDGSVMFPRKHYAQSIPFINAKVVIMINNRNYCEGSFQEGIPLK